MALSPLPLPRREAESRHSQVLTRVKTMASLKDMRNRIASTKATQKITKAMQMVAASKLRRAQAAAEAARPYAERMEKVLGNIAASVGANPGAPRLLAAPARPGPPPARLHRRARPVRAVQLRDRAARPRARQCADRRGQGGQVLLRRPQGLRAVAAPSTRSRSSRPSSCARCARSASSMPTSIGAQDPGAVRCRRSSTFARCSSRGSGR